MQVPLLDLKAQYASLRDEMEPIVRDVLESQYFINGPAVAALESDLAAYCNTACAVGVSSGTDALVASLMSLGICRSPLDEDPADEVITTTYTFFATAGSIWRVGVRPVFVDIEPDTFNIDPAKIEAAITPRTKAIMPVHLYGQLADMEPILAIAKKHNLAVIEDGAQAIGAKQNGKPAGSFGDAGCFSFFPSKNLGGLGDGGIVTTNSEALAERLRECRNHGMNPKYYHKWVGANFRLDTLQAAGLQLKLKQLDRWHDGRRANAAFYDAAFAEVDEITTPIVRPGNEMIYNQYIIRIPNRDAAVACLRENNIGCDIYYPVPMHQQECFAELGYKTGDLPNAESAAAETLALPIYAELTDEQQQYIVDTLKTFLAKE